ncbi:AraC family transcriptional regulator [Anaerocolumna sp. AGMB13025]|uniref:AraC family transcriptional regulator n=1 Tax=Anaerocolumna sp. AGMB13025 TaxID=3039116 RepID=UPI00241FD37B|nr:AraC family transcriptional regulator [Anaerocolumna sp. AGMB13025]WFR59115.1 AraC family transcriptional regulator [Anaerocolumna sp. AGMB13025]
MNYYYDAVLKAAKLIEDNLTADLRIQDIVEKIGFSQYHFMRVFKALSGHTIHNYIKRRKITEAAGLLLETDMRIIEIALLYGWNSQEAFSRAFKETYNVPPNVYRSKGINYRNVEQVILSESVLNQKTASITRIEPQIVYKEEFLIAGLKYTGKNKNYEIPKLWNELDGIVNEISSWINRDICYGLEHYDEEFDNNGTFGYLAGIEVSNTDNLPAGIDYMKIKGCKYAVFTIPALVETIPKSIGEIYSCHLPDSGLKAAGNYDFEYYDNFEANKEGTYLSFYIPIE